MILVDTSIWIDHLRTSDAALAELLGVGRVLAHPFVTGELALGNLRQRDVVLEAIQGIPQALTATESEVLRFIDQRRLFGLGIGYVDVHLLASVHLMPGTLLWTRDQRLLAACAALKVAYTPS